MTKVLQSSSVFIAGVTNRTMVILGSPLGFAAAPVFVVRRYILVVWLYTSSKFCKSCGKIRATCMLGSQETPCFSVSLETAVGMHLTPRGSQRERERERAVLGTAPHRVRIASWKLAWPPGAVEEESLFEITDIEGPKPIRSPNTGQPKP